MLRLGTREFLTFNTCVSSKSNSWWGSHVWSPILSHTQLRPNSVAAKSSSMVQGWPITSTIDYSHRSPERTMQFKMHQHMLNSVKARSISWTSCKHTMSPCKFGNQNASKRILILLKRQALFRWIPANSKGANPSGEAGIVSKPTYYV